MNNSDIVKGAQFIARSKYCAELESLSAAQLHDVLSGSVMAYISERWSKSRRLHSQARRAYYLSAEFLVGRAIFNNLMCLGLTDTVESQLRAAGMSLSALEDIEDAALGNGGLGRLAACFLDSAATLNLPLDGYGIRYRYGLFKQSVENGFQVESADDWSRFGDPWSVRRDDLSVTVELGDQTVRAVPYDMPVVGFGTENVGTLRLWQSEPVTSFDFTAFNEQRYDDAVRDKNRAEDISRVLYPNDDTMEGKMLRLKQQYFFSSASLQDMIRSFKQTHGNDLSLFPEFVTVQLNDTHPVISIPELIRILTQSEGMDFDAAVDIAKNTFNYTNHTVMQEALEKWDMSLIKSVAPDVAKIIRRLCAVQRHEFVVKKVPTAARGGMRILQDSTVHMANLAVFCSRYVNGVAALHTEILKKSVLRDWYRAYPERFQNKTNGITQRRWLALCNPELSALLTELLGDCGWMTDLTALRRLDKYAGDRDTLRRFLDIRRQKKEQLAQYIARTEGIEIDPESIFDIQIKRLHEYKRQMLNAFTILALYFMIKDGQLKDFYPTTFIFGAKSAPGYARAKGIIKLIGEIARIVGEDPEVSKYIKVVFVSNYNVSYAEKLVAAADVSEQISTAGTEASGTGNMKLMLNGAVTMGTFDGANIEIVEEAGEENNYIFGAKVEEIEAIAESYDPVKIYKGDALIKRVMDALVDGTLSDGKTRIFRELYNSILKGASWHKPDHYYLLHDFRSYLDARLRLNREYRDREAYAAKCWHNICAAGKFSSDRTIAQYAEDIWHVEKLHM